MKKQAIILGAGISGLSLAWFLKQKFNDTINIKIIEKTDRAGGWIRTKITPQGFLFEQGPHSFRSNSPETIKLIEQLNLHHELISANPSSKDRFIYYKKQLVPFPRGIIDLIFSPYLKMAIKALWKDWHTPQTNHYDESIYEFVSRRLGAEVAEKLFDPLVSGIYAGDIKQLSIASCFPDLHLFEQEHGGILKGLLYKKKNNTKTAIYTFKNGMEVLPRRLAELMHQDISYNSEISAIQSKGCEIEVTLSSGKTLTAEHLFSTLPAKSLAKLLDNENGKLLSEIPYASLAIVNLGFDHAVLNKKGFGYLIPSKEKQEALGVIFDSCVFPQQQPAGKTCLTVMLGGMHHPKLLELNDDTLKSKVMHLLASHLNIRNEPNEISIHRAYSAIPQYPVGYKKIMTNIVEKPIMPNMTIAGSFAGVSVNDCIANSKRIVNNCKKWD